MRSNLENIEHVDLYLQGKLTGDKLAQFEAEMATNSSLKQLVSDQQLLIQTVNRKALLAEISAVAGIGLTPWYLKPWFGLSVVAVGVIAVSTYFILSSEEANNLTVNETNFVEANNETINESNQNSEEYIEVIGISDTAMYEDVIVEHQITAGEKNKSNSKNQHKTNQTHSKNDDSQHLNNSSTDKKVILTETKTDSATTDMRVGQKIAKNRTAEFKNGDSAMQEFIAHNIKYPATAREKKLSGNVKVTFIVDTDGKISQIDADCYVLRDENNKPLNNTQFVFNQKVAGLFERESARIMRIMPAWVPATDSNGNSILTFNELQFNFNQYEGIFIYRTISSPTNGQ